VGQIEDLKRIRSKRSEKLRYVRLRSGIDPSVILEGGGRIGMLRMATVPDVEVRTQEECE
jgi:hypothetical protein